MHIARIQLIELGGIEKKYRKNEIVFHEGSEAIYYYQVISGEIKVSTTDHDNKEFTHGSFKSGDSFGDPPLILKKTYPSTASALMESVVIRLPRERLFRYLENNSKLLLQWLNDISEITYAKSKVVRTLAFESPEERIISYLNSYKQKMNVKAKMHINITRKEIGNYTGLCVETVIRTLSKMKEKKKVEIIDKKLYY